MSVPHDGIVCPQCGSWRRKTTDSRPGENNSRRRRQQCLDCKARWTTYEISARRFDTLVEAEEMMERLVALYQFRKAHR